eukprot:3060026-Rhodomonas_salina.3
MLQSQEKLSVLVAKGRRLMARRSKKGLSLDPALETIPDCHQVWVKPLQSGATAIALVNYGQISISACAPLRSD